MNRSLSILLLALAATVSAQTKPKLNVHGTCSTQTNQCVLSQNGRQWTKPCKPSCSQTGSQCIDNGYGTTAYCL
ncbi:hypothetical protein ACCO45_011819 [Purpureocillium lilacinum]|uniref:Uncharacterized protein n=1 Tax=Purpureocillium lilacinum TaxID=33203 RepID=A0ACC4DCK5_PURLI